MKNTRLILVIVFLLLVFLPLSFKKFLTSDTLIPNLEPYPDSLYYSLPAWNFTQREGFVFKTQEVVIKQQTPPLYGLYLAPFFALSHDVRSFYLANMLLMFGTIIFFVLTVNKFFKEKSIFNYLLTFILGFFLVTNFYFYNMSQLLMAEGVTLFLLTLGLYLFISKASIKKAVIAGLIPTLLMLTKLSNLPFAAVLGLILLFKYFKEQSQTRKQFAISTLFGAIIFVLYLSASGLLSGHKNLGGSDFSPANFKNGFNFYQGALLGLGQSRYLWFTEKFLPSLISFTALLGIFLGIGSKKMKTVSISLLLVLIIPVIFMSYFVTPDVRYIYAVLPVVLLFFGITIYSIYLKRGLLIAIFLMLILTLSYLFLPSQAFKESDINLINFKKQIGLNLRHREVPWNYEAVKVFNEFTKDKKREQTYIATFLPPAFIELFSSGNYQTLPISSWQEFYYLEPRLLSEVVGGDDVAGGYRAILAKDGRIYITSYYMNNVASSWPKQFSDLTDNFKMKKVFDGCLGACDIYELSIK